MILASYDITIRYRPGKSNQNADTLSRIPVESERKIDYAIREHNNGRYLPCKEEFIIAQDKDRYCIYKKSTESAKGIDLSRKLITHKGKIVVPATLTNRVIERFHDHILGGHLGITKTTKRISQKYFWPRMILDITNYINSCLICARRKAYGKKTAPLQPLEPSTFFWQRVAMDIVGPLPETYAGNRYILVMSESETQPDI
jgi:hypothetical protein